ncbi:hypothetical protein DFJ74DRAFT_773462 [Hyaloraphidium curvatum]|nr:hypothetical protein DFJ74DRAFT_773462 [Hyaloraphidium curvatum]
MRWRRIDWRFAFALGGLLGLFLRPSWPICAVVSPGGAASPPDGPAVPSNASANATARHGTERDLTAQQPELPAQLPPAATVATAAEAKAVVADAVRRFEKHGEIVAPLAAIESTLAFDVGQQWNRERLRRLAGLLRHGWVELPNRGRTPPYLRSRNALYCLLMSMPWRSDGYSTRSQHVAAGLRGHGWNLTAATAPGFPFNHEGMIIKAPFDKTAASFSHEVGGVPYIAADGPHAGSVFADSLMGAYANHFYREAKRIRSSVIISTSPYVVALPALAAARRLGVPFVYEVRYFAEITRGSLEPPWMDSDERRMATVLETQVSRGADLVGTLTKEMVTELGNRGVARDKVVLVPNAADASHFRPRPRDPKILAQVGLPADAAVVGFAGTVSGYEGLELLVEAVAQLAKDGVPLYLLVVGDGLVLHTVRARAEALGISGRCRFPGRVPHDAVPDYLAAMDVVAVVRPSIPVTELVSAVKPLEAMAMGRAMLLSDVAPHKTMAEGGRAALFRKGEVGDLAKVLGRLLGDKEERERMGRKAREWVERERNWDAVTGGFSRAIEALLEKEAA